MKKNILLYMAIISFVSFKGNAQDSKIYVTDKISDKYAYVDIIKTYERIAEKGYKSEDLFKKIGDSYYSKADFDKAAEWYCELFDISNDLEPEYYYQYAKCLLFIGQVDNANKILEKLKQKSGVIKKKITIK
ncbi:tetratricopeptide repeat protein [Flavobacterium glaciei]|uniref:Anaphase-promoting complex subunit 3 n=1 Tax=Flavobacterium glaciei TaxID=386300 RepID=A0A562PHV9_9FLAO|nr:CDC27 family protein [Flavobacterium glaciei]RDI48722.1 anaphase-promoting complex subunit 3 [Flavobacterium glaciei]TWI43586.1 anaphase-promoting complex subunit 3 [Flavobacterium glaciei]